MKLFKLTHLHFGLRQTGGRANTGQITSPRRGALTKRVYRFLDTKRNLFPNTPALLLNRSVYDPNRSARIALIMFPNGILTYVLAADFPTDQTVIYNLPNSSSMHAAGWSNFLSKYHAGAIIHNIEMVPGAGGQLVKAAGGSAVILRKAQKMITSRFILLKLKSGAHQLISKDAIAVAGVVSNHAHFLRNYNKAGTSRLQGKRPRIRPSSMNPVDHPMGGRTRGGIQPCSKNKILNSQPTSNTWSKKILISARTSRIKNK